MLKFIPGWFADPIYLGYYPDALKKQCGSRLPEFTAEEIAVIKESSDFFGLNHYTTNLVCECPNMPHVFFIHVIQLVADGGDNEYVGYVKQTQKKPDGSNLGTQGKSTHHCGPVKCALTLDIVADVNWLQSCTS